MYLSWWWYAIRSVDCELRIREACGRFSVGATQAGEHCDQRPLQFFTHRLAVDNTPRHHTIQHRQPYSTVVHTEPSSDHCTNGVAHTGPTAPAASSCRPVAQSVSVGRSPWLDSLLFRCGRSVADCHASRAEFLAARRSLSEVTVGVQRVTPLTRCHPRRLFHAGRRSVGRRAEFARRGECTSCARSTTGSRQSCIPSVP